MSVHGDLRLGRNSYGDTTAQGMCNIVYSVRYQCQEPQIWHVSFNVDINYIVVLSYANNYIA